MKDNISQRLPGVKKGVLLKDYTTYKIGGPAKYFFVAKSKQDLISAAEAAKEFKLSVFILGGGSNLLISDKGFNGLVVKMDISDIRLEDSTAFVGAGANLMKLAYTAADNGLSGLEWSAGVPGTIGGAIYGNAQAFGTKICDAIKSVEAMDLKTLQINNFTKSQCNFSLKDSIFKKNRNLVIVSAVLEFKKVPEGSPREEIRSKIREFLQYRKDKHPINFPSAGSVFVNPEILIENKKLLAKFPELEEYNKKGIIPSGYLIAKSGLCGKKAGNAQISEKHCNFIVNLGGAKAKDVLSLISLAKKKVKANFGISLEPEVQFVGFAKK